MEKERHRKMYEAMIMTGKENGRIKEKGARGRGSQFRRQTTTRGEREKEKEGDRKGGGEREREL